eukprot:6208704-Pleurochrysis_carterae.AAC.4
MRIGPAPHCSSSALVSAERGSTALEHRLPSSTSTSCRRLGDGDMRSTARMGTPRLVRTSWPTASPFESYEELTRSDSISSACSCTS